MSLLQRPAIPADAPALLELYTAYDTVEFGQPEMDLPAVTAILAIDDSDRLVLEEAGRVIGYAGVARSGEVESVVRPEHPRSAEVQAELLGWVVAQARLRGLGRIEHWAGAAPTGAARLLSGAGFEHARTMWRMARPLTGELPVPVLPDGVALRPFDRDRDAREVWALIMRSFAGTFGSHQRPYDEWSVFALGDGKDVLCAVEDGRLLAVATVGPRGGDGHVGQLAVDPGERGRGLALALLHEAFRRDRAAGYTRTTLTVDGENTGALRLYQKAGMSIAAEYRQWERNV